MDTLAITDFKAIDKTTAKVIISFTGKQTKDEIRSGLLKKFKNMAAPIEGSFKIIKPGVAVGFVRANKELRVVSPKEMKASYRVMSNTSNIMMDNKDKTLWEVKTGNGGKYLARHGNEDLSELVQASVNRRPDVPGLRHVSVAKAVAGEFVAFVSKTGDMDYGFALGTKASTGELVVSSYATETPVAVGYDTVTSIYPVPVPKSFQRAMVKAGISTADKAQANEYWRKLYSYDKPYMDDVIRQVNEDTVA